MTAKDVIVNQIVEINNSVKDVVHAVSGLQTSLNNPPVYLDLGGALAAFGLIFTVYQLRKPKWEIVLKIRNSLQRNLLWIFGGLGLFVTLLRVVLPPSFINPLGYEVLAYLLFIASPLSLMYLATRSKNLFSKKTAQKFYRTIVGAISQSNPEYLNAALEIVLDNFSVICTILENERRDSEVSGYASAVLDVFLSDESVVQVLTTKRLDALQHIFLNLEKYNINQNHSSIGVPKIINNLFHDSSSFFYKQLDQKGLALPFNLYEIIFSSPKILNNFDLFGYPSFSYSDSDIEGPGINVLIKALSRAIKTYYITGDVFPRNINNGLKQLSDTFGRICYKIGDQEKRGVDTKYVLKDEWWNLHTIAYFLGHDYVFIGYVDESHQKNMNQEVLKKEKQTSEADFHSQMYVNAGIAAAIYKAYEQLASIPNSVDYYNIALELVGSMSHDSEKKEGYNKPFEKRMWEQIGKNVLRRHYPNALKPYLEYVGISLALGGNHMTGWIGGQAERMRRLLYIDLKPLFDKKEVMVNKKLMQDVLLPNSMRYENGDFIYTLGFGDGPDVIIPPPVVGVTESALVGVDLDNHKTVI